MSIFTGVTRARNGGAMALPDAIGLVFGQRRNLVTD